MTELQQPGDCWKCRGRGELAIKPSRKSDTSISATDSLDTVSEHTQKRVKATKICSVCSGKGKIERIIKPARLRGTKPIKFKDFAPPGPVPLAEQSETDNVKAAAGNRSHEEEQTTPHLGDNAHTSVTTSSEIMDDEEICFLAGKWKILQKVKKHRYSTDDVVTAWVAWREALALGLTSNNIPYRADHVNANSLLTKHEISGLSRECSNGKEPIQHVDLGCGIGSVLLMTAWSLPTSNSVGVEAQETRAKQAKRSIQYNGCVERVSVIQGDLRSIETTLNSRLGKCDIVTGTPPYFDLKQGGLPPCKESTACLFEVRGGIEAYANAAAKLLAPSGRFIVAETALARVRAFDAIEAANMNVLRCIDVIPKEGKPPLFIVLVAKLASSKHDLNSDSDSIHASDVLDGYCVSQTTVKLSNGKEVCVPLDTICVRNKASERTEAYKRLLWHLGKPG